MEPWISKDEYDVLMAHRERRLRYFAETVLATPKVAKTAKEAQDLQNKQKGKPHGYVQWKGTDVCMDFHCKCGCASHIDAEFAYYVKCPECSTVYMLNPHIELIEVEQEPLHHVVLGGKD